MALEGAMAWNEKSVLDERAAFIGDWLQREWSIAELCRRYAVSEKTGYKMIGRFKAEGWEGLRDRSRAPHHHPSAVAAEIAAAVLAVRRQHPSWGPKKIRAWLELRRPGPAWPAESTIGVLLDRAGLSVRRRVRRRTPPDVGPLTIPRLPNDVWGVDFKGWFRTGDGARCDPFSLTDLHSRYILRLQALPSVDGEHVW